MPCQWYTGQGITTFTRIRPKRVKTDLFKPKFIKEKIRI